MSYSRITTNGGIVELVDFARALTRSDVAVPDDGVWSAIRTAMDALGRRDAPGARMALTTAEDRTDPVLSFATTLLRLRAACVGGDLADAAVWAEMLRAEPCFADPVGRAVAAHRLGTYHRLSGDLGSALSRQIEAESLFNDLGWEVEAALCSAEVAAIQVTRGDVAGGTYTYLSILDVLRRLAAPSQVAAVMVNLAAALQRSGNHADAEARYAEALEAPPFVQPGLSRATVLQNMAVIAKLGGRFEVAEKRYAEALECVNGLPSSAIRVRLLNGMADLAIRRGDLDSARMLSDRIDNADLAAASAVVQTEVDVIRATILALGGSEHAAMDVVRLAHERARSHGLLDEQYELLGAALDWAQEPNHRLDLLEEYRVVADERLKAVAASVTSIMQLRTQFEQERASREIERQQEIARVMLETQTRTMHDVGRDLHDSLGQDLTVVARLARRLEDDDIPSNEERRRTYATLRTVSERAERDARRIAHVLAGHGLHGAGLPEAIARLVADVRTAHPEMQLEVVLNGDPSVLPDDGARAIFRVLQTLIQNVLRHADASRCSIQLRVDEACAELSVEDNGRGFEVDAVVRGMGMREMSGRAALVGGTIAIDSSPGHGTFVSFTIPR